MSPTPAETARNEAAKQAVMLGFALVTFALMWPLYRKMAMQQAETMRNLLPHDPVMREVTDREARQQAAQRAAKRWDRLSTVLFRYGPSRSFSWAWGRAEKVRKAYDAERG